jgi:excisionase family DNA binding protein
MHNPGGKMSTAFTIKDLTKPLLKAADVAELLGISKSKAYQLMQHREIPVIQFGGTIRVHPDDLAIFLQGHYGQSRKHFSLKI